MYIETRILAHRVDITILISSLYENRIDLKIDILYITYVHVIQVILYVKKYVPRMADHESHASNYVQYEYARLTRFSQIHRSIGMPEDMFNVLLND